MDRKSSLDFPQALLDLYDEYVHGQVSRRGFLDRASRFAVGGATAAGLLAALSPKYALAQQVSADDMRIVASYEDYESPDGGGKMKGYLTRPSRTEGKLPGIIVIHENRGLNPYIEDVTRRVAVAGFVAFAPDALAPLGGYPGNDDKGRTLQATRDPMEMTEDFVAAAKWLHQHERCNGRIGVVGFCFGGGMANTLAVRLPEIVRAAVPYYGGPPRAEDVPKIKASILLQFAEHDPRVNAGWPGYEEALKNAGVNYQAHHYEGTNHGFHNDTTPRYDEAAAKLAWQRTIDFFTEKLVED
jgi:carboxymethylenebutenolidase